MTEGLLVSRITKINPGKCSQVQKLTETFITKSLYQVEKCISQLNLIRQKELGAC